MTVDNSDSKCMNQYYDFFFYLVAPTLIEGRDFLPFLNIEENDNGEMGELGQTLDGCSQPIYVNEGILYGSRTESVLRVIIQNLLFHIDFNKVPLIVFGRCAQME